MNKSIIFGTLVCLMLSGCIAKESKEETGADVTASESLDAEGAPPAEGSENAQNAQADGGGFLDESQPTETQSSEPLPEQTVDNSQPTQEPQVIGDAGVAAVDPGSENQPPPEAVFQPIEPSTESAPSASAEATVVAPTTTESIAGTPAESLLEPEKAPEAPKKLPLRKVAAAPYKEGEILINAVYIARPGDNWNKISTLIYGSKSKRKELQAANPSIKTIKPGSKIYYNSPVRPTDDQKLMNYYEDQGLYPEVYVAKEGDNIRKVSKELLGFDNAWQEVWSTNAVESKSNLTAGTELRYWKGSSGSVAAAPSEMPAKEVAPSTPPPLESAPPADLSASSPPPTLPAEVPPAMTAETSVPPPAPDLPPPPPSEPVAMNDLPPPPPPVEATPPPPPPPPAMAKKVKKEPKEKAGLDQEMMMTLGGGAIIAGSLAALIVLRRRRQQKEMAAAFNDSQVGT